MFAFGKTLKYTIWASIVYYFYHLYCVIKKDKPETAPGVNERFLYWAWWTKTAYQDLKELLTLPPVNALLGERPPLPPGYQAPKTLVLNVHGTLVHSEYKFGVGFEILKRPGLTAFVNRMSRNYEIALFGDQEAGHVMEIAEALDPEGRMIQGRLGRESTIVKGSKYIKDFSYLGRNIKDVIYIDFTDDGILPIHQANTIIIPEWSGDSDDRELIDLVPFLESK